MRLRLGKREEERVEDVCERVRFYNGGELSDNLRGTRFLLFGGASSFLLLVLGFN